MRSIYEGQPERLDKVLGLMLEDMTRTYIQKQIKEGAVTVNQKQAKPSQIVVAGDQIDCEIAPVKEPDILPREIPLDILYEDDYMIAVDKPSGLIVHPTFRRQTGTLANRLLGYYRRTGQACGVHIVTRLDRDTTGVVLFAKYAFFHWLLMEEQAAGRLRKTYRALTVGGPEADEGEIDLPIGRCPPPSLLRRVDPAGKPARTRFRVLERGEICRLELEPVTGRTHQLRVHCAHEGFPILGDPQYGEGGAGQRPMAAELRLTHPMTGEALTIRSRQTLV